MKLKYHSLLLVLLIVSLACKKDKPITDLEPGLIENMTFNSTVLIEGEDYNNSIIRNCIFEDIDGDGLQIKDVIGLRIENCTFRRISENAIRFRVSGSSEGVVIIDNEIYDIEKNGILAPTEHTNTVIKGNTIYNVATEKAGSIAGAPHHGIYFQGANVVVTENRIYNVENAGGNGVSIRTYGTISRNIIYNATDHGISYFSDHPGFGNVLLIENNMIYDNELRAINIASNGNVNNHVGEVNIRFNTLLSADKTPIGLANDLSGVDIKLSGNILVRTDGQNSFVFGTNTFSDSDNVKVGGDINFVNFVGRDLHITSSSVANGFINSTADIPANDIDNDVRSGSEIDAGADEI